MVCKVDHCSRPVFARGWCGRHYAAFRKYGDPLEIRQKQHHGLTVEERFSRYVGRRDDCWQWVGYRDRGGYGRMNVKGIPMLASRVSYLIHHGEIPEGRYVLHRCDTPSCVNPDHLFLGTQSDNMADMRSKGRERKRAKAGEAHPASKLTEDAVKLIRASNEGNPVLARRFGVSRVTIHDVRQGRTWRHVT